MESVNRLRYINVAAMLLVAAFNLFDSLEQKVSIIEAVVFTAPFIAATAVLFVFKNYKINAIIYAFAAIANVLFGNAGDFSGAVFLIFSIYIFNTTFTNYLLLGSCATAISARYLFMGYTIPDTLNQFVAYAFSIGVYFVLMHPKPEPKSVVSLIDETDLETVRLIYMGRKPKEIAFEEGVTPSAISKRIDRIKKKYECSDTYELFRKFENMGMLIPKTDNSE